MNLNRRVLFFRARGDFVLVNLFYFFSSTSPYLKALKKGGGGYTLLKRNQCFFYLNFYLSRRLTRPCLPATSWVMDLNKSTFHLALIFSLLKMSLSMRKWIWIFYVYLQVSLADLQSENDAERSFRKFKLICEDVQVDMMRIKVTWSNSINSLMLAGKLILFEGKRFQEFYQIVRPIRRGIFFSKITFKEYIFISHTDIGLPTK